MKKMLSILGVLLIAGVASAELHKAGYCIKKGRVLSDEEKIRKAIEYVVKRYSKDSVSLRVKKGAEIAEVEQYRNAKPYKTVEDFLSRNPECCKIEKRDYGTVGLEETWTPNPTYGAWVMGLDLDWIRLDFQVDYIDEGKTSSHSKAEILTVDNCGVWVTTG